MSQEDVLTKYSRMKFFLLIFIIVTILYIFGISLTRGLSGTDISIETYSILDVVMFLLILILFFPVMYLLGIEDTVPPQ